MVHLRQPQRGKRPPAVINVKRIPGLDADRGERERDPDRRACDARCAHRAPDRPGRVPGPAVHGALHGVARDPSSRDRRRQPLQRLAGGRPVAGAARPGRGGRDRRPGRSAAAPARPVLPGPRPDGARAGRAARLDRVPSPARRMDVRYERLDVRRAMDIAIAGVALALRLDGRRVAEARLALGAVAPTPLRVPAAEAALVEGGLAPAAVERAAELAMAAARPIGDVRATAEYRREMVGALVRRALAVAADACRVADRYPLELTVNGRRVRRDVPGSRTLLELPSRRPPPHGHEPRLRHRRLRRLHGAGRRPARHRVSRPGARRRRRRGDDHRGPAPRAGTPAPAPGRRPSIRSSKDSWRRAAPSAGSAPPG